MTACPKCGESVANGATLCGACEARRLRRADQQRNRRNRTHLPSIRVDGEHAKAIARAAQDLAETVWAFDSHMSQVDADATHGSALRVAEEMARAADQLGELLGEQLQSVKAAMERPRPQLAPRRPISGAPGTSGQGDI